MDLLVLVIIIAVAGAIWSEVKSGRKRDADLDERIAQRKHYEAMNELHNDMNPHPDSGHYPRHHE